MAMKMPDLRAFAQAHCGAVSLALGGEQRRTKAHVVRDVLAALLLSRPDSDSARCLVWPETHLDSINLIV